MASIPSIPAAASPLAFLSLPHFFFAINAIHALLASCANIFVTFGLSLLKQHCQNHYHLPSSLSFGMLFLFCQLLYSILGALTSLRRLDPFLKSLPEHSHWDTGRDVNFFPH